MRKLRLQVVAVAAVVAVGLFGWWAYPYVLFPPLLTSAQAVTSALGDAGTIALLQTVSAKSGGGVDWPEPQPTKATIRACRAVDIQSGVLLRGGCLAWLPALYPGCENVHFCAAIAIDPSISGDPILLAGIKKALQRPCVILLPQEEIPNAHTPPTAMWHTQAVDRRVLRCGRFGEVRGQVVADSPTAFRVRFK